MKSLLCALVMVVGLGGASWAAEEGNDSLRTITTSGEATVYVVPDRAVVTVGISTFNRAIGDARKDNDAAAKEMLAAVRGAGLEDRNISSQEQSLSARYQDDRPGKGIVGYVATRWYAFRIDDVKKVQPVVDAAMSHGGNELQSVTYETSELRKHRDRARQLAIRAAKEKASALAVELLCRVGSPRKIGEGYAENAYRDYIGSNNFQTAQVAEPATGEGDADGAEPLGQLSIRAAVHVVFDLKPALLNKDGLAQ